MTSRKFQTSVCIVLHLSIQLATCLDLSKCGSEDQPGMSEKVRLILFTGNPTNFTSSETTLDNPEAIGTNITTGKRAIVYIHGYTESANANTVQRVIKAYLARGDANVIAVDWSTVSQSWNYFSVCSQLPAVGKVLARALERLSKWIDLRALHVIGHSLGAHVAGYIGKFAKIPLARITGLDPALPSFYPGPCHVGPQDAKVVAIIHTNGGFFGTSESTGSIDFYANGGSGLQPGCLIHYLPVLCSHQRSVVYYAESIVNPKAFPAHRCKDAAKTALNSTIVYFTDSTPENVDGNYCFTTNAASPHGKGIVA